MLRRIAIHVPGNLTDSGADTIPPNSVGDA